MRNTLVVLAEQVGRLSKELTPWLLGSPSRHDVFFLDWALRDLQQACLAARQKVALELTKAQIQGERDQLARLLDGSWPDVERECA